MEQCYVCPLMGEHQNVSHLIADVPSVMAYGVNLTKWLAMYRKFWVFLLTLVQLCIIYEGWNFNSGNYLFTTDTK